MSFDRKFLSVYFILGSQNVVQKAPLLILEQALQGGITCFQFREKGIGSKSGLAKFELAQQMQKLCHEYQVPFFINDDVDLAIKIGADGIHVGQEDQSVEVIRNKIVSQMKIGLSVTSVTEAIAAQQIGVDYLGVGPIYVTDTKSDAKQPIGITGLSAIRKAVPDIPIVAIGGIHIEHVPEIRKAGADGVAVISAISSAVQPMLATESLLKLSDDV
ncbi:thiamine phosphate synthase [Amphibacillus sp. Q70]|uniref:thiamine phosphate synthase n=1 Tax=Amphibacillus sp. Q70 TaxID=3453416 RepID=UPI003F865E70